MGVRTVLQWTAPIVSSGLSETCPPPPASQTAPENVCLQHWIITIAERVGHCIADAWVSSSCERAVPSQICACSIDFYDNNIPLLHLDGETTISGAGRCTKWPTCSLPEGSLDFCKKLAKACQTFLSLRNVWQAAVSYIRSSIFQHVFIGVLINCTCKNAVLIFLLIQRNAHSNCVCPISPWQRLEKWI